VISAKGGCEVSLIISRIKFCEICNLVNWVRVRFSEEISWSCLQDGHKRVRLSKHPQKKGIKERK
jgi:hypothetical protein